MSKPRLTNRVLSGLTTIAGLIEAGDAADVLGNAEEHLDAEGKQTWKDVQRACEWVRAMQREKNHGGTEGASAAVICERA